jgi:hypothetical protein
MPGLDERCGFWRFPPNGTATPVDVDDSSVIVFGDHNVGQGEVPLYESRLVYICQSLNDLPRPLLASCPGEFDMILAVIIKYVNQSALVCIINEQAFDELRAIVNHHSVKVNDIL